jgi:OOP family OmpA-OmpF porin
MNAWSYAAIAASFACAAVADAQQMTAPQERGFYLGVGAGRSRVDFDTDDVDATVRALGFATSSTSADETDTAWKLFGGYRFNRYFALELGYTDLGRFTFDTTTTGPAANFDGRLKGNVWSLDAVGIAPLGDRFSLFGKVGVIRWDLSARVAAFAGGAAVTDKVSDDGFSWKLGLGAQYQFTPAFGARLEWERLRKVGDNDTTGKGDVDLFTLGLLLRF